MPGDNGELNKEEVKVEKTSEQLKQEKIERFNKDPETFIELDEVVFVAIRNSKSALGMSIWIGNCKRSEMDIAEMELIHATAKMRLQMDMQSAMKSGKIVPAKEMPKQPFYKRFM